MQEMGRLCFEIGNRHLSLKISDEFCKYATAFFPVGAFTLSNGLETYVQHDIITSPKGLEEYLHSYISVLPYNELGAAAATYNADEKELCRLDEIYSAAKTPFEIRSGSEKVTRRFFKICNNGRESFTGLYKKPDGAGHMQGSSVHRLWALYA